MATQTLSMSDFVPPDSGVARRASAGSTIGGYTLVTLLGSGGMADVWLASRESVRGFEKRVALKTIKRAFASDPKFRRMFRDEACVAVKIRHANVVEVLDLGEDDGVLYQAMSLVEGSALAGILDRAPETLGQHGLPAGIAARIVADALRGLAAAHALKIVHRDVCPRNILVGLDGVAKLSDFGIARPDVPVESTDLGHGRGKDRYFAPERRRGVVATRRSDLYSMAVVLWETLTGVAFDPLHARVDPREHARRIPEGLAKLTLRGLSESQDGRFASATAMADAIEDEARRAGCLATSQGVAELVARCIGSTRPTDSETCNVTSNVTVTKSASHIVVDVPEAKPQRSRKTLMLLVGFVSTFAVAGSIREAEPRVAIAPAHITVPAAAPAAATAPATATAAPPAPAPAPALASRSTLRKATPKPTASAAPPPPPVARPSFGNPYE